MELCERIEALVGYSSLTIPKFAEKVGFKTPQGVRELIKGNTKTLSDAAQMKILDAFPEINGDWLLNGEGEMLKSEAESLDSLDMISQDDKVPEKYLTWLVPTAAMGGSLVGFENSGVRREDCERIISPIAGADWAVPVFGDSMEPEYPNGSKVFVKQITPGDFIAWGNVFVLDTTNGLIIKMVVPSENKNCIKCVSLNPSGRYQPFDVPMRTIRAMYRVMACISVK